jgi:2-polyprenyl-6-methoxyphenol hydroxylase-like FAD-dependent oxidoreductase
MGWSVEDASGRDRQALVVGRVPAAVATAGFLDQAGLNPVLAEGSAPPQAPAAVVLWRPGLELLERLGLRRPVETAGTPLTALRCAEPPQSWRGDDTGRPPIVAVRRGHLRAVARQHLAGRFRTADRRVTAIQPADSGVRATFEGGIEEPFDGVASVGPAARPAIPGGYLGPALAVEDGWVLADTLAYGPAAVDDALAAYADRRRRRLLDVSSALRDDALRARAPADLPRFLRYLCACRTLAFGHLFDSPAEELLWDVPDRL